MTDLVEGTNLVAKDGKATGEMARWMKGQTRQAAALNANIAAKAAALSEFGWPVFIEFPDNKAYRVCLNSPIGFTINSITTRCTAGTCTLTASIDGVNLGGTANSVSTTEQTQSPTSANVVAVGADVPLTITSNSSAENVSVMISGTRAV